MTKAGRLQNSNYPAPNQFDVRTPPTAETRRRLVRNIYSSIKVTQALMSSRVVRVALAGISASS